jgi:cell division protein FtsI/penicillin-binding protein 2
MTNALEQSSNIGMAYVARKLGRELFYDYIEKFGFGDYSYINLVGEQKGKLVYWKKWTEAKLLTSSFGQGISVTPIQMIQAWMALANGGVLIQPQIVKAVLPDGQEKQDIETTVIRRVLSEDASQKISAMLVSAVDNGVAIPGKVDGYRVAGKTGTSQIACADNTRCKNGSYEKGEGTTVTSFGGYAPIEKPKFVVLVKFERPRIGDNTWGSTTAAPVFKDLMKFLLQYYDIAPDE